ncbi:MAG: hypothetical protein IKS21_00620 [Oscillospiraceae bacterium]|nr:hypothetical protein [Oscillospiraceae bacterium]
MPAQRDEPSAPPQAENDMCRRIVVALRATGRLVPAFRRGMSLPYGTGTELFRRICSDLQDLMKIWL